MDHTTRPLPEEAHEAFQRYIGQVDGDDLFRALNKASDRLWETVYRIPTGYADHRYAPGKWSIKEVFQHLVDTERIMCYRALRFARNDATELPGFSEDRYILNAGTEHRELHELLREHDLVRASTIAMFRSFTDQMLMRGGIANGNRMTVRAIAWMIAGHAMHHMDVVDERYLARSPATGRK